jgi:MFS family permease
MKHNPKEISPVANIDRSASLLLVPVAALPMLQAVLITPILEVIRDTNGHDAPSTFLLRVIVASPALTIVLLLPLIGRFADRFQRRDILIFGLALYAACGLSVYVLPRLEYMLLSRLFLGVALACLMTVTTALSGDLFKGRERDRILGLQYAASATVGLSFPVLAGLFALVDWRLAFLTYLLAALLIVPAARLPDRPITRIRDQVKFQDIALRPILGIFVLIGIGTTTLWLITIQLAFHLSEIGYTSPLVAGLALGAPCLSGIAIGMLYGRIKRKLTHQAIAASAYLLTAIGYGVISVTTNLPLISLGLLLAGAGFGLNQPNCNAWLLSVVATEYRARAAAGLTFAVCAGQIASPLIYQPMVAMAGSAASFRIMSGVCAAVAIVTLFAAARGTRTVPAIDER